MRRAKIFLTALIVVLTSTISLFAQQPRSTMDMLTATVWQINFGEGFPYIFLEKYSTVAVMSKLIEEGKKSKTVVTPYYISDAPDRKFDKKSVGKADNGRYIIEKAKRGTLVYEVVKIDDTMFQLKYVPLHPEQQIIYYCNPMPDGLNGFAVSTPF